jgi:DNA-directed RNA polymerase specialized sigma24 family protein
MPVGVKSMDYELKQEVLKERAREDTRKRGGASLRRVDVDLEAINSHTMSSEERVLAEEGVEAWLTRLYRRDPLLRAIATRKSDGFNCHEIAAELGLPLRAVEYGITLIKAILTRSELD